MDFLSTTEMAAMLDAGQVSATDLTEESIRRIERQDTPLNAVVVRDFGRAREAAAQADADRAKGDRRPLLGIPITVKEAFNVQGLPTTWGQPTSEPAEAGSDAVAVARLKRAGAIVIGKTNIAAQLADWQSFNPVYGTTSNPWDVSRTPGGSSGGSAAALAAGFVSLELGSDLGGSLRIPAHCCGVFAHKPTFGLVPMRGFVPPGTPVLSISHDIDCGVVGPMARTAADLALALDVLAGPDDADALAYSLKLPAPRHSALGQYRVLLLDHHPMAPVDDEVLTVLHRFANDLEREGCQVGRRSTLLPDLESSATLFTQLVMSFFGADMPEAAYEGAHAYLASVPKTERSAPAMQELRGLVASHRDWIALDRARLGLVHQWRQLFKQWDVVLCPVMPTTAIAHDHGDMNGRHIRVNGHQVPYKAQALWATVASVAGLPATAMPIGIGSSAMPVGAQVIGAHLEDRSTLSFAQLAERAFGGFVIPPAYRQ